MGRRRVEAVTETEVRAMDEYIDLLQQGRAPGIEDYLAGFPEFEDSLRPVLEGAELLVAEHRSFRARHPDADLLALLQDRVQEKPGV